MKIAIISDTHDNLANIKKAISFLGKERVEMLLHCGDVVLPETLKEILLNFSGKVYLALGNADKAHSLEEKIPDLKDISNLEWEKEIKEIEVEDKKIALTHFPILAKNLAKSKQYNLVFYGHTHFPYQKKFGKTNLVNPGNLAGLIFKATFSIYDTDSDKLELKILEKL